MRTEKVAVFTESGLMARRLSAFRSGLQTFALTTSEDVRAQLALIWGVRPFHHKDLDTGGDDGGHGDKTMFDLLNSGAGTTEELLRVGERLLIDSSVVETGETIIMMAGRLSGMGLSSSVIVWSIGENVPRR
jgi:pyruvate kinase